MMNSTRCIHGEYIESVVRGSQLCTVETLKVNQEQDSQSSQHHSAPDDLGVKEPMQPRSHHNTIQRQTILVSKNQCNQGAVSQQQLFGAGKNARRRSFTSDWYRGCPWLEYSKQVTLSFVFHVANLDPSAFRKVTTNLNCPMSLEGIATGSQQQNNIRVSLNMSSLHRIK